MARLKFLLAFLALIICAGGVLVAWFYWKKFAEPEMQVTRRMKGGMESMEPKPDLGIRHYDKAVDLLKEGELVSARDRLIYLMTYFPESDKYADAKRIVGEVNLDLLISNIPQPQKDEHTVRRGEALVTIARRNQTTIDYIMRANGKTTSVIYPDEVLTVCPLEYRVEIDLKKETVTVFSGEAFFKEYAIVQTNLPPDVMAPVSTTISEKVAWHVDRPVNFTDANYLDCSKWIRTGKMGLFLRELDEKRRNGGSIPFGVMVARTDMEELFTILRVGSKVSMVN